MLSHFYLLNGFLLSLVQCCSQKACEALLPSVALWSPPWDSVYMGLHRKLHWAPQGAHVVPYIELYVYGALRGALHSRSDVHCIFH